MYNYSLDMPRHLVNQILGYMQASISKSENILIMSDGDYESNIAVSIQVT